MTSRKLLLCVAAFVFIILLYVPYFFRQPPSVQEGLKHVGTVVLGIPAAALAFAYQLRLSRISRLDAWNTSYQNLLQQIAEWNARADERTSERDTVLMARWHVQAVALDATLRAIGIGRTGGDGSIGALGDILYQMQGCPVGTKRRDGHLTEHFEDEFWKVLVHSGDFINSLYS